MTSGVTGSRITYKENTEVDRSGVVIGKVCDDVEAKNVLGLDQDKDCQP